MTRKPKAPANDYRTQRKAGHFGPDRVRQSDAFETFEAHRQAIGASREEVCGAAGINLRNYERLVSGTRGARKATLAKIKAALRALERQKGRAS